MVFAGYSGFLHHIQLASHDLATFGINVTKSKIPNSKFTSAQSTAGQVLLEHRTVCKSLGAIQEKKGRGEERAYKKSLCLGVTLYKMWGVSTQMSMGVGLA